MGSKYPVPPASPGSRRGLLSSLLLLGDSRPGLSVSGRPRRPVRAAALRGLPSLLHVTAHTYDLRVYTIVTSKHASTKVDRYRPRLVRLGRRLRPCGRPLTSLHFSRESSEHRGSPRAASRPRARPGSGASTRPGRTPLYDRGSATRQALLTGAAWTAYRSSTHKRAESILSNLWH